PSGCRLLDPRGRSGGPDPGSFTTGRGGEDAVKVLWVLLATVVAVAAQTTLDRWFSTNAVDLVLVVVVYNALSSGRVGGMLAGSFAGLVQDSLSGGVIGMSGLSKTIVGFVAGIIGTQFIVTHSASRFV